jgi:hypothetical protein
MSEDIKEVASRALDAIAKQMLIGIDPGSIDWSAETWFEIQLDGGLKVIDIRSVYKTGDDIEPEAAG